jgi:YD repeat-containing protein
VNRYGVVSNFSYYTNGSLHYFTDANGNTITYEWSNGRISKITNPIYFVSRVINSNGTVASETNGRGHTTSFTYDTNLRLTQIPPASIQQTLYPTDNSYKDETRGGFNIRHNNDGFGRPTGSLIPKGSIQISSIKPTIPKLLYSNIGDTPTMITSEG